MPEQPLPKSYKRKYHKLLLRFDDARLRQAGFEIDIRSLAETAVKIEHDIEYLLDTLYDLAPAAFDTIVSRCLADDDNGQENASTEDGENEVEVPEYFKDLPWDLSRHAVSGSLLEDRAALQRRKLKEGANMTSSMAYANTGNDTPGRANANFNRVDYAGLGQTAVTNATASAGGSRKRERDQVGSPIPESEHSSKKRR